MPNKKRNLRLLRIILFVLNLIAAIGLAGAILATFIPPSIFPFFSVLALIYPILVLTNLAFIVLWIFLRSWRAVLSLVILLLGYSNIQNNFQFNFNNTLISDSTKLKVITYNVQLFGRLESDSISKERRADILQFIQLETPQITCLQEYYSEGVTPYGPLENMKTELNVNTHYYESYFSPVHNQLTGLVIFSKYPAVDKGKLKFNGTRTFGIYTDLLINGDTIRVYNIHLASIQLAPADIDFVVNAGNEEKKGVKQHALKIYSKLTDAFLLRELQMSNLVDQLSRCKYPVILCGDFNDTPSSFVFNQIDKKLQDTFREKGKGLSITYAGQIPFLRIDYVMKSGEFETLDYRRHKAAFSDHFPVSVILSKN